MNPLFASTPYSLTYPLDDLIYPLDEKLTLPPTPQQQKTSNIARYSFHAKEQGCLHRSFSIRQNMHEIKPFGGVIKGKMKSQMEQSLHLKKSSERLLQQACLLKEEEVDEFTAYLSTFLRKYTQCCSREIDEILNQALQTSRRGSFVDQLLACFARHNTFKGCRSHYSSFLKEISASLQKQIQAMSLDSLPSFLSTFYLFAHSCPSSFDNDLMVIMSVLIKKSIQGDYVRKLLAQLKEIDLMPIFNFENLRGHAYGLSSALSALNLLHVQMLQLSRDTLPLVITSLNTFFASSDHDRPLLKEEITSLAHQLIQACTDANCAFDLITALSEDHPLFQYTSYKAFMDKILALC